jgi:fido (protein-threonine AMPylation protein)
MLTRRDAEGELVALHDGVHLLGASPLDLRVLLALHRRLLPPSHPYRGRFRDRAAVIRLAGAVHRRPPPPDAARRQAQDALDWLDGELASGARCPGLAAEAMYRLTAAHPFLDGNGRVALTVASWILVRSGYTVRGDPIQFCRQRKPELYSALAANDHSGSASAWSGFFERLVLACFDIPAHA